MQTDREILIAYLFMKARQGDWHGVRDACVDIETLDAKNSCKCQEGPLVLDSMTVPRTVINTDPDTVRT